MKPGFLRTAALLLSLILGAFVPQATALSGLISWLIMGMLYVVFLQTRLSREALHRSHAFLLAANLVMGAVGWLAGWALGGRALALTGFFCGITPTATAAPVIISFLKGRVDYVIAAFLLTNLLVAALLPALIPALVGTSTPGLWRDILGSVVFVIFGPLLLAWLTRVAHPAAVSWPSRLRNVTFGAWVFVLFLITARVSRFLRDHRELDPSVLVGIAGFSLALCLVNFLLGRWIGGRAFALEASQSLGQKNTTLTIYLALTYASPLIAFGPTCYVVWHNLWNSWQLHRHARSEGAPPPA